MPKTAPSQAFKIPTDADFEAAWELGKPAVFALFSLMRDQISLLLTRVDALTARIESLEASAAKNSGNSSKPPSSDGLGKKPASLRELSGNPSGGQPGHSGSTLAQVSRPDAVETYRPERCRNCGGSLGGVAPSSAERRQVFELPPVSLLVTEHRKESVPCPACGTVSEGEFPEGVTAATQYGPRFLATGVYLQDHQLLPLERAGELMGDLFGHRPSDATLVAAAETARLRLEPVEAAVAAAILREPVAGSDETGVRVAGKLAWLHAAVTPALTWYGVHAKRGKEAMDSFGILPRFLGTLVHDCFAPYFSYACRHALCGAHLLRELVFLRDVRRCAWAEGMRRLLLRMKGAVAEAREAGLEAVPEEALEVFYAEYCAVLEEGYGTDPGPPRRPGRPRAKGRRGRTAQSLEKNLLDRLSGRAEAVLAFLHDFSVPFDNNQSERDVRMTKVKQKISGGFRTEEGAKRFCRVRGYVSTMRKQGVCPLEALESVFAGRTMYPAGLGKGC